MKDKLSSIMAANAEMRKSALAKIKASLEDIEDIKKNIQFYKGVEQSCNTIIHVYKKP